MLARRRRAHEPGETTTRRHTHVFADRLQTTGHRRQPTLDTGPRVRARAQRRQLTAQARCSGADSRRADETVGSRATEPTTERRRATPEASRSSVEQRMAAASMGDTRNKRGRTDVRKSARVAHRCADAPCEGAQHAKLAPRAQEDGQAYKHKQREAEIYSHNTARKHIQKQAGRASRYKHVFCDQCDSGQCATICPNVLGPLEHPELLAGCGLLAGGNGYDTGLRRRKQLIRWQCPRFRLQRPLRSAAHTTESPQTGCASPMPSWRGFASP
mmetsp:Transcript_30714/g.99328  ORF Transcript_30714/g.99328 Transcript_30714/m.99328 type:complete len:272 (+) Transcript_30714:56-871(+)